MDLRAGVRRFGKVRVIFRLQVAFWIAVYSAPFIVLFVMMCGYGFFTPAPYVKKYKDLNEVEYV